MSKYIITIVLETSVPLSAVEKTVMEASLEGYLTATRAGLKVTTSALAVVTGETA